MTESPVVFWSEASFLFTDDMDLDSAAHKKNELSFIPGSLFNVPDMTVAGTLKMVAS